MAGPLLPYVSAAQVELPFVPHNTMSYVKYEPLAFAIYFLPILEQLMWSMKMQKRDKL